MKEINIEQVIEQLWDVRCRRIEDDQEIRDRAFLAINVIKQLNKELQEKELIFSKMEGHLIRNGKEMISLTHENCLLTDLIANEPNKEELLLKLEELKKLPVE